MIKTIKKRLFTGTSGAGKKTTRLDKKTTGLGKKPKVLVGWQEWCALPKLHIPAIKAKIDTGAKTSALHAADIRSFHRHGAKFVHFTIHPLQRSEKFAKRCTALVIDERTVKNSGGHKELRYVIHTTITLGQMTWEIEITLTNRDPMVFRMLLGRDALKGHSVIDPGRSLCQGKLSPKQIKAYYTHLAHSHVHSHLHGHTQHHIHHAHHIHPAHHSRHAHHVHDHSHHHGHSQSDGHSKTHKLSHQSRQPHQSNP